MYIHKIFNAFSIFYFLAKYIEHICMHNTTIKIQKSFRVDNKSFVREIEKKDTSRNKLSVLYFEKLNFKTYVG